MNASFTANQIELGTLTHIEQRLLALAMRAIPSKGGSSEFVELDLAAVKRHELIDIVCRIESSIGEA